MLDVSKEWLMSGVARIAYLVHFIILIALSSIVFANTAETEAEKLRTQWAIAKFQTPKANQNAAFEALIKTASEVNEKYPNQPKVMVWYATILSTHSQLKGGMGSLSSLKLARELLEEAIHKDPDVEKGFAEGVLGTLYARVPGWPISFGSKQKARQHLERAVELDPKGMDSNYYFGDFLIDVGDFQNAKAHLEIAKNAPIRAGYEIEDQGRKTEIAASLAKMQRLGH
jgi:tetratricopeptide (TPR) repeat protein